MNRFRIKKPTEAQNDILNPSFEGSTGFALTSATGGRVTTEQHGVGGPYSCQVVPTGTGYVTLTTITLTNLARVFLAWVKGNPTTLTVGATNNTNIVLVETGANGWNRWAAFFTAAQCSGQTTCAVKSTTTIYVDDCLLYAGVDPTDGYLVYFDGHNPTPDGRRWLGGRYTSASKQQAIFQNNPVWDGGLVQDLEVPNLIGCELAVGLGVHPVTVQTDTTSTGRVLYRDSLPGARTARLTFWWIGDAPGDEDAWQHLTEVRADTLSKIPVTEPFSLLIDIGNTTQEGRFVYRSGLEGNINYAEGAWEKTVIELEAQDPNFYDLTPSTALLTASATPFLNYVATKEEGTWRGYTGGPGLQGPSNVVYTAPDGTLYWATNNVSGTAYVQKWNGEAIVGVAAVTGSITAGPQVYMLAMSPDGLALYIGGDYTAITPTGGSTVSSVNGIAKLTLPTNVAAKVPSAGTGLSGGVILGGEIDPSGTYLVVGGTFTSVNGVSVGRFARMTINGETWSAVASAAFGAAVQDVACANNGDYLVVGKFDASTGFSTPAAPSASSVQDNTIGSVGLLIPGYTYRYKRTVLTALGETDAGSYTEVIVQHTGGAGDHNAVDLSWSAAGGAATGYRFYRTQGYDATLAPAPTNLTAFYFFKELGLVTSYRDKNRDPLDTTRTPPTANTSGHRTPRAAWYDASAAAWKNYGILGFSGGDLYCIDLFPDQQTAVVGGDVTSADSTACGGVAYIQGPASAWLPLSVGMGGGAVLAVKRSFDGRVWAGGAFTSANGNAFAAGVARFDGFPDGVWQHTDITLAGSVTSIAVRRPDEIILGHQFGATSAAAANTVTHTGTARWKPRIIVTGPGPLRSIAVYETGGEILTTHTLATNEEVTIDPDTMTVVSNVMGDLLAQGKLRPGTSPDLSLLSGASTVTVYAPGCSVRLAGRPANVSIDKAAT